MKRQLLMSDARSRAPIKIHPTLIAITRRELSPGYQAVQSAHAAIDFQHQHPTIAREWNKNSNYLIFLSVENEQELKKFIQKFQIYDINHTVFIEPDLDNQITAVCAEPSERTLKLCSHLPLALGEFNESLTQR